MPADALPAFDELPLVEPLGLRCAWDVFGRDDVLGTINLVTPERVARAAREVTTGEVVRLDLPLDVPDPPLFGRQPYRHEIFPLNRNEADDRLHDLHPQASTQWDALSHVRCRELGYWGGRTEDPTAGANPLGIEHWAARGIAGRGVLVDVARWRADQGRPLDALEARAVTVEELRATLAAQGVEPEVGDIWCLRTGWPAAYRRLDGDTRARYAQQPTSAGLSAGEDMARFLWDHHPAALCADNPAVEVVPGDPAVGSLHRRLIPMLGFALGELFDLEVLAERCRTRRRWTFWFLATPLRLPGGVGSPGNAVAVL